MCEASCQPTIRREKHVDHEAEEQSSLPAAQIRESPTQSWSGAAAVKSRLTRSGRFGALGPGIVVRHGFPRRFAPQIPLVAIKPLHPATRHSPPARRNVFHIFR